LSAIVPVNPWPLVSGSSGTLVVQLQKSLNKWAKLIGLTTALVTDGLFGPATKAAVILAQVHFAERGVTAGYCTQALFNELQAAPPSPPVYGPPLSLGVANDVQVTVTWAPPTAVANVGAVTGYVVTLTNSAKKMLPGYPQVLPATQTSLTLLLPRGEGFNFTVAARSANGTGKTAGGPFTV
jgi:peptidoglycan hydrolase-like protein with peptidoglycan-binding domain